MNLSGNTIENIYRKFTGGSLEMDNRQFVKLAKDTKILDKKLTPTDMDILFSKIKYPGSRKIFFDQFQHALEEMSRKKGISVEDLEYKIISAGGPSFNGTIPQPTKFHDDKNLYTGVYKHGGPSTVDEGNGHIHDISSLCDRSGANVRGVKK